MAQPSLNLADLLDVLACEIGVRPAGAPSPEDLATGLRGIQRTGDALTLTFAPAAAALVEAFAEAERRCCAGIDWRVKQDEAVTLHIRATATQLDAIAEHWLPGGAAARDATGQ